MAGRNTPAMDAARGNGKGDQCGTVAFDVITAAGCEFPNFSFGKRHKACFGKLFCKVFDRVEAGRTGVEKSQQLLG